MAANVRTEMRIPTRAAPRPPGQSATRRDPIWSSSNDIFEGTLMAQPVQKKKPPPRPPPPKFNQNHMQYQKDQKPRKPARPTELLTNFFGRKKQENPSRSANYSQHSMTQSTNLVATMSLIDLSPPGSPTSTTRSSSDGVSVDSFGSDGNSNPSAFTSSGNTSQTESAFEDDFDFFGISKKNAQNDPWQSRTTPQDPFGPLEDTCPKLSQVSSDACFVTLSSSSRITSQVPSNLITSKLLVTSMPTIIRVRPPKPPAPQLPIKKFERTTKAACNDYKIANTDTTNEAFNLFNAWPDDSEQNDSVSPPMPTIPPPAPPANYLAELNSVNRAEDFNEPYGIALYDFPASHPNDLTFNKGDFIQLLSKVNDDWAEGRIRYRRGIFPLCFIDVKIPLPDLPDNVVTAIYTFLGENDDDLSFERGANITVISRISENWLYGEYNGREGQFPVNYINKLPRNI